MPLRSVIDIDVNDDAFKQFQALFDKYAQALQRMPAQWGAVNTAQQGTRSGFVEMASALMAQNELLHRSERQVEQIDRRLGSTSRTMQGLSRATREFAGNLTTATSTLLRWTGVSGVVGSLAGLLSSEGIGHLARSASGTFRTTMGYAGNTTPAQVGALGAYSGILDPRAGLSRLTEMMQSSEGKAALTGLGFTRNDWENRSAGQLLPEFLRRLQRLAQSTPEANLTDALNARHLSGFGEEARVLRRMTPQQLAQLEEIRARNERELAKTTGDMLFQWVRLQGEIDVAGTKIRNAFITGLTPLTGIFRRLTDAGSTLISRFLDSAAVKDALTRLAGALERVDIESFTKNLEAGATKLVQFGQGIDRVLGFFAKYNKTLDDVAKPGTTTQNVSKGILGGILGGATLGGMLGGPPGIVLGAGIGAVAGAGWGYFRPTHEGNTTETWDDKGNRTWTAPIPPAPGAARRIPSTSFMPPDVRWMSGDSASQGQLSPVGRWYTGIAPPKIAEGSGFNVGGIRAAEGGFRTYPNAYAGVADMGDLLKSYGEKGFDTLDKIINRWAPPSDNNPTETLIQRASQWTGFNRNQQLDLKDPATLRKVMIAMHRNEFGGNMKMDQSALDLYLSGKGPGRPGTDESGSVGIASQWLGLTRHDPRVRSYIHSVANIDPETAAWCAAFANGVLAKQGIKGTGSNIATSFINWGQGVDPSEVKTNDVIVLPHGHRAGETGGHVGFATGRRRGSEIEMISGNTEGGRVAKNWVNDSEVIVRRGPSPSGLQNAVVQEGKMARTADRGAVRDWMGGYNQFRNPEQDIPVAVRKAAGIRVTVEHQVGASPANAAAAAAQ